MKNPFIKFTTAIACALLMLAPTGCKFTDTIKNIYSAGTYALPAGTADQVVSSAERGTEVGLEVMRSFVHQEKDHRELFDKLGTKPHEYSVWLRVRVPSPYNDIHPGDAPKKFVPRLEAILETARIATKAFKANRTPENEANLRTAWATLKDAIDACKSFTTAATGK